jgi:hypothetical protein
MQPSKTLCVMPVDLRRLVAKLNETTRSALESAAALCLSRTHYDIEIEHYLLKLMETSSGDVPLILKHFQINVSRLYGELSAALDRFKTGNARTPSFSPSLVHLLRESWALGSLNLGAERIRSGFTLLALAGDEDLRRLAPAELQRLDAITLERDFTLVTAGSIEIPRVLPPPETASVRIFISYRREDSQVFTGRIRDRLQVALEVQKVLIDSDSIEPGALFPVWIEENVKMCDVFLAVIGKRWLRIVDSEGRRRLDNELDWVRLEIAAALKHGKTVIPCLIDGARMPRVKDVPEELGGLLVRQALPISHQSFDNDMRALAQLLRSAARSAAASSGGTVPGSSES